MAVQVIVQTPCIVWSTTLHLHLPTLGLRREHHSTKSVHFAYGRGHVDSNGIDDEVFDVPDEIKALAQIVVSVGEDVDAPDKEVVTGELGVTPADRGSVLHGQRFV